MVEESLEVIKTFLEILQAALAAQGRLPSDSTSKNPTTAPTAWQPGNTAPNDTEIHVVTDGPTSSHQHPPAPGVSYITAQQAQPMTCYSYILLTVDDIVGAVTSKDDLSRKGSNGTAASISVTSHAVADLVSEREQLLVEKLAGLTRGL